MIPKSYDHISLEELYSILSRQLFSEKTFYNLIVCMANTNDLNDLYVKHFFFRRTEQKQMIERIKSFLSLIKKKCRVEGITLTEAECYIGVLRRQHWSKLSDRGRTLTKEKTYADRSDSSNESRREPGGNRA